MNSSVDSCSCSSCAGHAFLELSKSKDNVSTPPKRQDMGPKSDFLDGQLCIAFTGCDDASNARVPARSRLVALHDIKQTIRVGRVASWLFVPIC